MPQGGIDRGRGCRAPTAIRELGEETGDRTRAWWNSIAEAPDDLTYDLPEPR